MNPIDPDTMLLYVAGVSDPDESAAIEAWLSSALPAAAAVYAESLAVFNAIPLSLDSIDPPKHCRSELLGRIAAAQSAGPRAAGLNWPVYATTGLAACLAVALSVSLWNNRQLTQRAEAMSQSVSQLQSQNEQMARTVSGSQQLMMSPHLSMVSLKNQSKSAAMVAPNGLPSASAPTGRVLFCPTSKLYAVTVFGLPVLPPGRAYELWLINGQGEKVPAGTFRMDERGVATMMAHPDKLDVAVLAAITDEPAQGSAVPTGEIHLAGDLQPAN